MSSWLISINIEKKTTKNKTRKKKISSTSTTNFNFNFHFNNTNDNEIESFEDLENKCLHDYEQGCYSPVLVNLNNLEDAFARSMDSLTADDSIINTVVLMDVQYL